MDKSKKVSKKKGKENVLTSFKAYKKKYFPKKYAEEESMKVQPLRFKR
jgi:hypothetical protein